MDQILISLCGDALRGIFSTCWAGFWELDRPADLVDLDAPDAFAQYLQKEGVLLRVG